MVPKNASLVKMQAFSLFQLNDASRISSRIDHNLVRKRVRIGRRNRWNVVFVAIYNIYYLHGCLLQAFFHGSSHFRGICP